MKKVTLKQIAIEAGVSPATLSRIVNRNTHVSDELKEKVAEAMRVLGVALPEARQETRLHSGGPSRIGLVVADLSNPYFQMVIRGVMNEARTLDYGIQLFETNDDVSNEEAIFNKLTAFDLDGIILCASRVSADHIISFRKQTGLPIVLVNRFIDDPKINCIFIDYRKTMYLAASYLIKLGHQKIAFLAGPSLTETSRIRRLGILKAMNEAGLELKPDLSPGCFPNVEGGFQAMTALLSLPEDPPTAVLAYNDLVAVGALQAIHLRGLRVPEDISIMGVDNIDIINFTCPPLTSVAPPVLHMGATALRIIDSINKGETVSDGGYIDVEAPLILRYSTGPVPQKIISNMQPDFNWKE